MNSKELRGKFLKFFEKKGHKIVPSSSLIPTDLSVLFTTAGMQQFKEYYLGKKSPYGNRVVSCQKCFRTSDIEEVGDEKHLTFLEMLGNFSFGEYFKKEAIELALEFLIENCKLKINNFKFTYFKGDKEIPLDRESEKVWNTLGFSKNKGNLHYRVREDNFWGPTGLEGPCGPTTEIHIGGVEIWNLVFNEYYQDKNGKLTPLKQKGVDTGMGFERLAMIVQNKPSVFDTDLFEPILKGIEKISTRPYSLNPKPYRIIADHIKGAVFLISEGILPSNVERGYVLRRILRRAIRYGKLLNLSKNFLIPLAQKVVEIYADVYPEIKSKEIDVLTAIQNEEEKFEKTLEQGLKELDKIISWWREATKAKQVGPGGEIDDKIAIPGFGTEDELELGKKLFDIFQSYGFPLESSLEEFEKIYGENLILRDEVMKSFQKEFKRHQKISRAGVGKKFGGIGKEATYQSAKLHTATHLLHAALRQILGKQVKQMGSDITPQRLRFDFSHPKKMVAEEIKRVEDSVNQKIKEDLEVKKEEMSYEEAMKSGALAFFQEKYPERVTVYSIGDPSDPSGQVFSKEICAGPHIKQTSELGKFKILKEESSGAGIRRIKAVLE